jgi:hypothetical protein
VRAGDDFVGSLHCGLETKGLLDKAQIIVDGLGDADDTDAAFAALDFVGDCFGPA